MSSPVRAYVKRHLKVSQKRDCNAYQREYYRVVARFRKR